MHSQDQIGSYKLLVLSSHTLGFQNLDFGQAINHNDDVYQQDHQLPLFYNRTPLPAASHAKVHNDLPLAILALTMKGCSESH